MLWVESSSDWGVSEFVRATCDDWNLTWVLWSIEVVCSISPLESRRGESPTLTTLVTEREELFSSHSVLHVSQSFCQHQGTRHWQWTTSEEKLLLPKNSSPPLPKNSPIGRTESPKQDEPQAYSTCAHIHFSLESCCKYGSRRRPRQPDKLRTVNLDNKCSPFTSALLGSLSDNTDSFGANPSTSFGSIVYPKLSTELSHEYSLHLHYRAVRFFNCSALVNHLITTAKSCPEFGRPKICKHN